MKKHIKLIVIAVEILILTIGIGKYVYDANTLESYTFPSEAFTLNAGEVREDEEHGQYYYIDSCSDSAVHFIFGPYFSLSMGSYRMTFDYESAGGGSFFWLFSRTTGDGSILGNEVAFDADRTSMSSTMFLTKTVHDLECRIIYMSGDAISFYSVTLEETMYFDNLVLFGLILLLVLFNVAWYYKSLRQKAGRKIEIQTKYVVLGIICTTLLTSMPCFMDYIINTQDYFFHETRIEGLKDAWLSGQFPARIQPTWFDGAGYACSVFYGELFFSIPAFLRLLGLPMQLCVQFFEITINFATCAVAYTCFRNMSKNKYAAIFGAFIYTASPYRLNDLFFRCAFGEATAMIFLPLVLYGMWCILHEDTEELGQSQKKRVYKWLPLTLGITGIIQSHILTCEMVCLFLIVTCLIYIRRIFQKKRYLEFLKAVLATLILNAWFLVPFLDYFRSDYRITTLEPTKIQSLGAFLSQIFMLFVDFNASSYSAASSVGIRTDMPLTVGLALGAGGVLAIALAWTRGVKKDKLLKAALVTAILGFVALFMSTNLFPYDAIFDMSKTTAKLVSTLQFPWRFLALATCLLSAATLMAVAYGIKHVDKSKLSGAMAFIVIFAALSSMQFMNQFMQCADPYRVYNEEKINKYSSSSGEYLPENINFSLGGVTEHTVTGTEDIIVKDFKFNGTNMEAKIENPGEVGTLYVTYIYYPGYTAVCKETSKELQIKESDNNTVTVEIPGGFTGTVKVKFIGKWYWRVAEAVTYLGIIGFIGFQLYTKRKQKKQNMNETI